jgi:hypothetical protein
VSIELQIMDAGVYRMIKTGRQSHKLAIYIYIEVLQNDLCEYREGGGVESDRLL